MLFLHGQGHRTRIIPTVGRRLLQSMSIIGLSIPNDLSVYSGSTSTCMFILLQDTQPGPFCDEQTGSASIKWTISGWIIAIDITVTLISTHAANKGMH